MIVTWFPSKFYLMTWCEWKSFCPLWSTRFVSCLSLTWSSIFVCGPTFSDLLHVPREWFVRCFLLPFVYFKQFDFFFNLEKQTSSKDHQVCDVPRANSDICNSATALTHVLGTSQVIIMVDFRNLWCHL